MKNIDFLRKSHVASSVFLTNVFSVLFGGHPYLSNDEIIFELSWKLWKWQTPMFDRLKTSFLNSNAKTLLEYVLKWAKIGFEISLGLRIMTSSIKKSTFWSFAKKLFFSRGVKFFYPRVKSKNPPPRSCMHKFKHPGLWVLESKLAMGAKMHQELVRARLNEALCIVYWF